MKESWLALAISLLLYQHLGAQPAPGDVFREYRWFHETGDAGQAMRVGGRRTTLYPDRGSVHWPHDLDLKEAIKAEIVAEKILCHEGTTGLAIQINDGEWFHFPKPRPIPPEPSRRRRPATA